MKKKKQDIFYVAVDPKKYKEKPKGNEIGAISNRIANHQQELALEKLAKEIKEGKSYLPCRLKQGQNRKQENWEKQNLFVLDIDEGMTREEAMRHDFIRSHASFLHTTFSHTNVNHKLRIVFASDKVISNPEDFEKVMNYLFKNVSQADKACKDMARLYFAGTDIYWIDETNRLNVDEILSHTLWGDKDNNLDISPQSLSAPSNIKRIIPMIQSQLVDAIKDSDILFLQRTFDPEEVALDKCEVENYLKSIPLYEFLGIEDYKSFIDIFHDENNPSASIFKSNTGSKHWLYKCHSASNEFCGSIVEVTMKLQNKKRKEVLDFWLNAKICS